MNRLAQFVVGLSLILLFSLMIWGVQGLALTFVMVAMFWTPVFLIVSTFALDEESLIISWVFGFGIVSSISYPLGLVTGSLTKGVWISWIILMAAGLLLQWKVAPKWKNKSQPQSVPAAKE